MESENNFNESKIQGKGEILYDQLETQQPKTEDSSSML